MVHAAQVVLARVAKGAELDEQIVMEAFSHGFSRG
jgi:hypothetical protein